MKRISPRVLAIGLTLGILLDLTLVLTASAAGGTWKLGPVPAPFYTRFDAETATVGGVQTIFVLGGRESDGTSTDGIVWKATNPNNWAMTGANMQVPISNYKIASLTVGTKTLLFTFGGRHADGTIGTEVQFYDPSANTTGIDASDPWPGTTPSACVSLPAMGVEVVNNKAYLIGGNSFASSGCVDDNSAQTWVYDPNAAAGARWKQLASFSQARGYITTISAKGKILAIGGDVNSAGSLIPQATVEVYNVSTNTWTMPTGAQLPEACDESQAFLYQGAAVLAGCGQWPAALADTWIFNGTSWAPGNPLNVARRNHAGFMATVKGKPVPVVFDGYAADGFTVLDSLEFDPDPTALGATAPRTPISVRPDTTNN